ncbi:DNA repair protein RecN [Bacteroidales bacterium OttesenSCG-928-B11]|nr:DNA repair protein RecN [Bacteroidales bacterium OttesenSCG-928-B11]
MLSSIHIENYALIRSLDIHFDKGFTVITGETGAGKSILLGALSLITGNRADSSVLLDKTKKCFVEADFDIREMEIRSFFDTHNLDYSDNTILRREINSAGKSRAFINDTPVTLQVLKELANLLVDVHSQHQHLLISNPLFRLQIVDDYADNKSALLHYQQLYYRHETATKELHQLQKQQQEVEERKDYLSFLAKELDDADLQPAEDGELEEKITMLSHAETIKSTLYANNQLLSEQDPNITAMLTNVKRDCESLSSYSAAIAEITQRLELLLIEIKDISYSLSSIERQVEVDPGQLDLLQQRLDLLYTLLRKHHVADLAELIEKKKDIDAQLTSMENNSEKIKILEKQRMLLNDALVEAANRLTERRLGVAPQLQQDILHKLQLLGMKDAHFHVDIESHSHHTEMGSDKVGFYFSANRGVATEEISKIASGGELSRMMLAIKSVITENALLPTVVFDEIDTGISGEIAGKAAKLMTELSQNHQLIVITHLPQIAAKGTLHYHVYKETLDNQTFTKIRQLTTDERVDELAKMMSDETITPAARETAKMLMGIS